MKVYGVFFYVGLEPSYFVRLFATEEKAKEFLKDKNGSFYVKELEVE